ncbi:MAG: TRAP transporter permease [Rhodospirillaceae bacterium]|jgi:TRAP transporter 4TM/12TM fusion protein|nr:TRAP transporter permease [Rhodospirillaceae bacterium]MBT4771198.1 TRAP transporter permease [Rhodospirillaceae bacterium]MBT5358748.1 TRAP transporter permease [Rhodospirillaceae bacterium]MBT5770842.1 TRAP transporter permease [Rhodospirillaceae bacterium]MBT6309052.1 TRAP transporter permease [Rhodospirillaceae bacterium]
MSSQDNTADGAAEAEERDFIAEVESGPRSPTSKIAVGVITLLCVIWSLFQLWIAENPINSQLARSWHLGFALALVFLAFPAYDYRNPPLWARTVHRILPFMRPKRSNREFIPVLDIVLALIAAGSSLFIVVFQKEIQLLGGIGNTREVIMGSILIIMLLEAARRSLGVALSTICIVFIVYAFVGSEPWVPDLLRYRGTTFEFFVSEMYLTDTSIFGVPLGVSTSFVFLFVLFGALLDRAGAGKYFIDVAFSGLGHKIGGPAKAAVVASGLSGLVSGSSIANVVTTGTFTIPLMKKVGLPAYKAGAVEVAASTNGQLMPPIMGAAAFIMADIIGIPYLDVVRAALFPAIISYLALFYVVHLEALKLGLKPLSKSELPPMLKTLVNGSHYLIPLGVLIYFLVIQKRSPIFSALTAIEALAVLMVIQRPIIAYLALGAHKKAGSLDPATKIGAILGAAFLDGLRDIWEGLVGGARSMMSVGVATAAAGIIVGVVSTTGLTGRFVNLIGTISGGNVSVMLVLTAITSMILGMGLPTTANYILMATLTAPVIVELGGDAGLIFPLIAAHLFVFYFGILADDTPPVGLAAYAAAAIAKSDPIKTGIQGFTYDMRTAILPFVFLFNTELLMISGLAPNGDIIWIDNIFSLVWVFGVALVAMFAFAGFMQGYFADKCNWVERIILLALAIGMFRPALITDEIGVQREIVQGIGVAVWILMYLYQKRRLKGRGEGAATAAA